MIAKAEIAPPDADDLDFEFELVNVDDIPDDEWDDELREAVAYADAHPGEGIPHELVMEWLSRVGTPEATPMPKEWLPK